MTMTVLQHRARARFFGTLGAAAVFGIGAASVSPRILAADNASDAAADAAADDGGELFNVVVTSRKREERVEDVPIPISVLGGKDLERDDVVALEDLSKKLPGLETTTPNSRRTGIAIRGIGKSAGNDALEASMGVIVDGVFLSHPGMTYQDFTDLDRVELLRGPQGTLLGKNATIGVLNYVTRGPSFTPEGSGNFFVGEHNTRTGNASYSNAISPGLLAYRASIFVDKQDGDILNVDAQGGRTSEKNRTGGRVQFLLTPADNFSVKLNFDFSESNERSNTQPTILLLTNYDDAAHSVRASGTKNTYASVLQRAYFGGYQPVVGSWDTEDVNQIVPVLTRNDGGSAELNWKVGNLDITSITASRNYIFDAKNDSDYTKFDVGWGGNHIDAGQTSEELRVASTPNSSFDYQAGLFFMHDWNTSISRTYYGQDAGAWFATGNQYNALYTNAPGKQLLGASLDNVYSTTTITPDTKSYAAFSQVNWHITDKATLTAGVRDTYEKKTNTSAKGAVFFDGTALSDLAALGTGLGASTAQAAAAAAIRASQLGAAYPKTQGVPITGSAVSWLFSPSYKLTQDTLLYGSAASGEKSGSVQFSTAGAPQNVNPEKVFDIEAGVKALLLDRKLRLDVNLYQTHVKDYQQVTSVVDPVTTQLRNDGTLYYASVLGNIPGITARGVEFELDYDPIRSLSLNWGGAYNHATYTNWHTATCAPELNVTSKNVICDNTGRQVVAAPKYINTVGFDFHHVVYRGYAAHFFGTNVFRTRQNFDVTLSRYGWQGAYSVTDAGVGILTGDGAFELDLLARNAFNTQYTTSISGAGTDRISYDGIGARRWVGLVLHVKF